MRTAQSYKKDFATFSGNASTTSNTTNSYDNISWGMRMINDGIRYLATMFYFNETSYVVPGGTVASQQSYQLPPDFESLTNMTVQVGGLLYQCKEAPSRKYWDSLNLVPFYNDYPQYYFIWDNKINIYPIPASSANVLTLNYKKRVTDLSMDDVTQTTSASTVSPTTGDATIVASGIAPFTLWMAQSGWIQIPFASNGNSTGDNKWYQIATITDATHLELKNQYTGPTTSGCAFTIGDVPILPEDYQDLPLYRALRLYYSSKVPDAGKAKAYKELYDEGYALLDAKYGSKSNSPVLNDMDSPIFNPNLFPRSLS